MVEKYFDKETVKIYNGIANQNNFRILQDERNRLSLVREDTFIRFKLSWEENIGEERPYFSVEIPYPPEEYNEDKDIGFPSLREIHEETGLLLGLERILKEKGFESLDDICVSGRTIYLYFDIPAQTKQDILRLREFFEEVDKYFKSTRKL